MTNFTSPGDIGQILSTTLGISKIRLTAAQIATKVSTTQRERPPEQHQKNPIRKQELRKQGQRIEKRPRSWEGENGLSGRGTRFAGPDRP